MSEIKKEEKQEFVKYATPAEELAALQKSLLETQLENALAEKEDRKLRNEELKFDLEDKRQRVEKRQMEKLQEKENREAQGRTFAQKNAQESAMQKVCTHKKGGIINVGRDMNVLSTGGDSAQYAVIKHQMLTGELWIRCLRCSKTWLPPKKENFFFDERGRQAPYKGPQAGKFDQAKFEAAEREYLQAMNFFTRNTTSKSVHIQFSKWDAENQVWIPSNQHYSESMLNTNLR